MEKGFSERDLGKGAFSGLFRRNGNPNDLDRTPIDFDRDTNDFDRGDFWDGMMKGLSDVDFRQWAICVYSRKGMFLGQDCTSTSREKAWAASGGL